MNHATLEMDFFEPIFLVCTLDSNDGFAFEAPPPDPALRPQTAGGGAGSEEGEGADGGGAGLECISTELLHQLQSDQLTVRQFCSALMTYVTPLVVNYLNRDFPWVTTPTASPTDLRGHGGGEERSRMVAVCVCVCLQLVECGVELMECEATPSRLHHQEDDGILRVSLEWVGKREHQLLPILEEHVLVLYSVCGGQTSL